jgi:hypothetical protein
MADVEEEYYLFVRRMTQFHHIWTVYWDLLSGRYVPSTGYRKLEEVETGPALPGEMVPTLMYVLYAFFYSLVEDAADAQDAFRIWRMKYPEEETAIAALELHVIPMRPELRVFRNRLAFHGSRSQGHELKGYELFGAHSGTKMIEVMNVFKLLNAALIQKDAARQHNSAEEMATARALLDSVPSQCRQLVGI